jgi:hypothetical protein
MKYFNSVTNKIEDDGKDYIKPDMSSSYYRTDTDALNNQINKQIELGMEQNPENYPFSNLVNMPEVPKNTGNFDSIMKSIMNGLPGSESNSPLLSNSVPEGYPSPMMSPEKLNAMQQQSKMAQPAPVAQKSMPAPSRQPTAEASESIDIPAQSEPYKRLSLQDLLSPLNKQNDELAAAQQGNQDFIRAALMARAANKIGSSIAGVKADDKYGQDAIDFSNKKVSDLQERDKAKRDARNQAISEAKSEIDLQKANFELGDKEKENDPNSAVSKAFREYAKSYVQAAGANIKIDDRLSYADLQKQMGSIGNIVTAKMAQDARRDNMMLAREGKIEANKTKLDDKNMQFMERQLKGMKESKNYKAAQTAENLISTLEDALKNPSAIKEIAATYQTVKSLDPDSAVREGEIGLLQQGVSLRAKADALASKLSDNPKVYGPQFLKTMQDYATHQREVSRRMYEKEFNSVKNLGKRRGMSDEDVELMNPMPSSGYTNEVKSTPQNYDNDPRIDNFMKKNNIKDRNEAIQILKKAKRL